MHYITDINTKWKCYLVSSETKMPFIEGYLLFTTHQEFDLSVLKEFEKKNKIG